MSRLSRIFIGLPVDTQEAPAATPSQTQSFFRFGADDGSEALHTWLAAQDVNITQPGATPAILRIQVDNVGDFPTQQMKLQCKKTSDPDSAYLDVSVAP